MKNKFESYSRLVTWFMALLLVALAAGCGGSGGGGRDPILGSPTLGLPTLVSIAVTPTAPSIANGTTIQFIATGTFSDNTTQNITSSVTWSSVAVPAVPVIANISNAAGSKGLATAAAVGVTTITAADPVTLVAGTTTLTVTAAVLNLITVTPTTPSIANGTTIQFTATGTFSDNTTQNITSSVTWSSVAVPAVPVIANISNAAGSKGLATAAAPGVTTITATDPVTLVAGTTTLTVTAATLVSIQVTPTTPSIANGTTIQFTATGTFSNDTTQNITLSVTWSSLAVPAVPVIATISNAAGSKGLATAVAAGVTTIAAVDPLAPGIAPGTTTLTVTAVVAASCAAGPLPLGRATNFGVLAGAALTITNPTSVTGNVGSPTITPASGPSTLVGTLFDSSPATDLTVIANAVTDMRAAIACAVARPCGVGPAFNFAGAHDFGGSVGLAPGHYCVAGAMSVGSNLTLSAPGVYIFDATGALTSAATITVQFGGAANAANSSVFWVSSGPASNASIGATNTFLGTIMVDPGAATLGANTTLLGGRVLSGSAVTLNGTNTIAIP